MSYLIENTTLPSIFSSYLRFFVPKTSRKDFGDGIVSSSVDNNAQIGDRVVFPKIVTSVNDILVNNEDFEHYLDVCEFSDVDRDVIPSTYFQVLCAPLHLQIFAHEAFPFTPFGVVHVRNEIEMLANVARNEKLQFISRLEDGAVTKSGVEGRIVTTASVDGNDVWRSTLTFFRRGQRHDLSMTHKSETAPDDLNAEESLVRTVFVEAPANLGRTYARISKDFNPIHLSPVTARPFGFRRAILHGMWLQARILAELEHRSTISSPYTLQIDFRRPILLPAVVQIEVFSTKDGFRYVASHPETEKEYATGAFLRKINDLAPETTTQVTE